MKKKKGRIINQPPTYPRVRFVFSPRTGVASGRARAYARRSRVDPAPDQRRTCGEKKKKKKETEDEIFAGQPRGWSPLRDSSFGHRTTVLTNCLFFPISRRWGVRTAYPRGCPLMANARTRASRAARRPATRASNRDECCLVAEHFCTG